MNHRLRPIRPGPERRAFTLVEALTSLTIAAMAGAALLVGIASALDTTQTVEEQAMALGMAQQLMDELAGTGYSEAALGPYQTTLGPEAGETGTGRTRFDDLDDYHGLAIAPTDLWGVELGQDDGTGGRRHANFTATAGYFKNWWQEVEAYYVSPADMTTRLGPGQTSDFRAVHVRVFIDTPGRGSRKITDLKRIFANVPAT